MNRPGMGGDVRFPVLAGALAAVIVITFGTTRFLSDSGWIVLLGLVGVIATLAILFLLPVEWLPAAAVVLFAVVPNKLVPNDGIFGAVPPISIVLLVWVFRRLVFPRRLADNASPPERLPAARAIAVVAAIFFVLWAIAAALRSAHPDTGFSWIVSFCIGALLVMIVPNAATEARYLREAWIRTGFYFGLYAFIEIALQQSPVFGTLFDALGYGTVQHWSVYRAEASFGHPLWAGAYLTPPAVLGIVGWLQTGGRRYLLYGSGSAIGVVATVSRGSILAMGIAIGVAVIVVAIVAIRRPWWRILTSITGGAAGIIFVLTFPPLAARSGSLESGRSLEARDLGTSVALKAAEDLGWLGSGPGTSGISGRLYDDVVIENSFLQLLISVGIPGLFLFVAVVASLAINALRIRDIAAAAALLSYIVAISGFNAIDAIRALHVILGLLFLLCLYPAQPVELRLPPPVGRRGVSATSFDWRPAASPLLAGQRRGRTLVTRN